MSSTKTLLVLVSFASLGLHCKKEEAEINKLPPATSYGAGTFSFALFDAFGTFSVRVSDGRLDLYCY